MSGEWRAIRLTSSCRRPHRREMRSPISADSKSDTIADRIDHFAGDISRNQTWDHGAVHERQGMTSLQAWPVWHAVLELATLELMGAPNSRGGFARSGTAHHTARG